MTEHHRDDLIRMVDLPTAQVEFRDDDTDDGRIGTLVGYAAVFNEDTRIDSWEGKFVERLAPGAFAKTLKDRGSKVKVLFNHGFDPQIGDKPLGKPYRMEEDEVGLATEVPLDDTSYNRDLVASLRSGALDGMSFRFSVTREDWDNEDADNGDLPIRTIREVKLYEFGPVTFPAYEATTAGVRGREAYQAWRTRKDPHSSDADPVTSELSPDTPPTRHLSPEIQERADALKDRLVYLRKDSDGEAIGTLRGDR